MKKALLAVTLAVGIGLGVGAYIAATPTVDECVVTVVEITPRTTLPGLPVFPPKVYN